MRLIIGASVAVAGLATVASAAAGGPVPAPGKPGNPVCIRPDEPGPEKYGPTDIGAVTANGRLSVAVNPQGTLSVFRWPSVSQFSYVSQPHVWEHTLFYLAAIEAYGRAPYRPGRPDRLLRPKGR